MIYWLFVDPGPFGDVMPGTNVFRYISPASIRASAFGNYGCYPPINIQMCSFTIFSKKEDFITYLFNICIKNC